MRRRKYIVYWVVLAVVLVITGGCRRAAEPKKCGVTVSLPAVAYFVDRLLPDSIEVGAMIPPGDNHDTYSPQPSQLVRLTSSVAYVALGPLEFETTWRERIVSSAPEMKWIDISNHVDVIGEGESRDPHYWLSPRRCRQMVEGMRKELTGLFPSAADYISTEARKLDGELATVDSLMVVAVGERAEAFLTYHPSLTYIAADYGLEQLAIESEGIAVSANSVRETIDRAREKKVGVFFVQAGYDEARVGVIAEETGGRIVKIEPEGSDPMECMMLIARTLAGRDGDD